MVVFNPNVQHEAVKALPSQGRPASRLFGCESGFDGNRLKETLIKAAFAATHACDSIYSHLNN
jgi:hypothetical protein